MNNKRIAIIPARGGSKRIKKKNIKDMCGKPLIEYSIEVAHKSGLFDKIIVSTDTQEIADIALKAGAEVPFVRPDNLADDFTGTAEVILHALEQINDISNYEYACCIYPTALFLSADELRSGLNLSAKKDGAFSVALFPSKIQRALRIDSNDNLGIVKPENLNKRSNDLEDNYYDAGQFYWLNIDSFKKQKKLWMEKSAPVILPQYKVQDIDTEEDWEMGKLKFNFLKEKGII